MRLPDIQIPNDIPLDQMPDLLRHWYLGPPARRHMMLRRFDEVDRELPPTGEVLDIGSAWGFNVMALERMGYSATGMDLVTGQFDSGRRIAAGNDVSFRVLGANAAALPFPDASFDAITMVETFEHIFLEDRPRALAECRRVLRPGGTLVLSTPNYASVVERMKRFVSRHGWIRRKLPTMCYPEEGTDRGDYHPYHYHHPLPDDGIVAMVEGAGLKVATVRHFLFMLKNTSSFFYPLVKVLERVGENIPGIRRLAATVCVVARVP